MSEPQTSINTVCANTPLAPASGSEFRIIYKNRYPVQQKRADGMWGCRGCGSPIPKGRESWCSNACYAQFDTSSVVRAVWERDRGVCCTCGIDTEKIVNRLNRSIHRDREVNHHEARFKRGHFFNRERYDRARVIWTKWRKKHNAALRNRCARLKTAGFPPSPQYPWQSARKWWEADHIVPYSEGGLTVLENMRTLCVPCHKQRTKKWHRDRVEAKDPTPRLNLDTPNA